MKVLQVNVVCGIGSTGRIATNLHGAMLKEGYESYIAYGRGEGKHCETTIKIGSTSTIYRHVALTRVLDKHGFGSKSATERFIREVEILNPDVIHLHNLHGYYINIEILFDYLKKSGKPVVWTLHDCWSFTGHCCHFEYAKCEKWKTGCFSCPERKGYPKSLVVDNTRNNYKAKRDLFTGVKHMALVTPSKWLAGLVGQSFLMEYPVRVIHNGIDLEVFRPTMSDFREEHCLVDMFLILGVASVWNHKKGFTHILELSKQLQKEERIVLVGVSDKQKQSLPSNVIGITHTNSLQELASIYSASDVFLNPTLEDTYPTTNLEALACGTPVVSFSSGGSTEMLNKERGVVTKSKDMYGILQGIKEIRAGYEKGLYDKLSDDLLEFSSERMSQKYIEVYKGV